MTTIFFFNNFVFYNNILAGKILYVKIMKFSRHVVLYGSVDSLILMFSQRS